MESPVNLEGSAIHTTSAVECGQIFSVDSRKVSKTMGQQFRSVVVQSI